MARGIDCSAWEKRYDERERSLYAKHWSPYHTLPKLIRFRRARFRCWECLNLCNYKKAVSKCMGSYLCADCAALFEKPGWWKRKLKEMGV